MDFLIEEVVLIPLAGIILFIYVVAQVFVRI